jgi:hypothetical protein
MDAIENKPLRLIRLDRETEKAEVVGVRHQSGLAAYTYLPT